MDSALAEEFDKDPLAVPQSTSEYYNANAELISLLRKDITRTFSELDFFQMESTQQVVLLTQKRQKKRHKTTKNDTKPTQNRHNTTQNDPTDAEAHSVRVG